MTRRSAIAITFVANGLGAPSFLARLPDRQADLGLSDLGLGVALVGLAAGALVASPMAGRAVGARGSRPVVIASAAVLGASLWTVGAATRPALFFVALVVVGAADAAMDISMNANGAAYEARSGRSFLHRLHGAWSLGALGGAALAAAFAGAGVSLTVHLVVIGGLVAGAVVATGGGLVRGDVHPATGRTPAPAGGPPAGHEPSGQAVSRSGRSGRKGTGSDPRADPGSGHDRRAAGRRRPPGALVALAAAVVAGAVIEGGPSDWAAIQLERLGVGMGVSPLGYAAFMAGMLAGRSVGDRLTDAHGGATVLRGGMVLGAVGLAAGVAIGHPVSVAAGLVLAGAGASGLFPLAFSAAARLPGVEPGAGAATVALTARIGFLVEPLLMGAIAEAVGLGWAFGAVAGIALVVAAGARRIIPPTARATPMAVPDARGP